MKIGVIVATLGRPQECEHLLDQIRRQTIAPAIVVFSVEKTEDLPSNIDKDVEVVIGSRGLCAQRNRGIARAVDECDAFVFYDDDFVPSIRSISGLADLFASDSTIVGATGYVLADGVVKGGISAEIAAQIVAEYDELGPARPFDVKGNDAPAYGCNMAFRSSAARDLRFDERLALYGWQEDVDFGSQIAKRGKMVRTNAFCGVHRGVTHGRTPGVRLGYSQVVNPVYLVRKGTMRFSHAARIMIGNLLANHLKWVIRERHIDRLGRARGNWRGLLDLMAGNARPEKITEL
jgi:GT2 family glycosyltransferase